MGQVNILILPMILVTAFALTMTGWMKSILNEKGYKSNFIDFGINHLKDYPNFLNVILDEKDTGKKRKYKWILVCNLLAYVLFIFTAYLLIKS